MGGGDGEREDVLQYLIQDGQESHQSLTTDRSKGKWQIWYQSIVLGQRCGNKGGKNHIILQSIGGGVLKQ